VDAPLLSRRAFDGATRLVSLEVTATGARFLMVSLCERMVGTRIFRSAGGLLKVRYALHQFFAALGLRRGEIC